MGLWRQQIAYFAFAFSLLSITDQVNSKDVDTSTCYSSTAECGQHSMICPEDETVIITNARYGHKSRNTPCSRGKISSCNSRYKSTCCRASGDECYLPYNDKDAHRLLQPCLGSRTCFHMTPQIHKQCAKYMLTSSTLAVVTHRCMPNSHIIGYNTEDMVNSDEVILQYRIPTSKPSPGTANVYGCDVIGSEGKKVKVKALNVGMASLNGRPCSSLEFNKDGKITSYSCERSDLRFLLSLYEGVVPFEINIVEVSENPPSTAWILVEGKNITADCGKVRPTRIISEPTTTNSENDSRVDTTTSNLEAPAYTTTSKSIKTTLSTSTVRQNVQEVSTSQKSLKNEVTDSEPPTSSTGTEDLKDEKPVSTPEPASELSNSQSVLADTTSASNLKTQTVETSAVIVQSHDDYRVLTYSGIAGGLLLLIILIIIITVICYRRKRYRLYHSRKIEEERKIPDGEERASEKVETDKTTRNGSNDEKDGNKGDNSSFDSPVADQSNEEPGYHGNKRNKGRKEKGRVPSTGLGSSPPRVSQPRDSDGYTNTGKQYGNDDPQRNVTVEFYDNPGFKTTIDNIKISE